MNRNEPIAAISTPYGRGGIAVIRMSGEGVLSLADTIFKPSGGKPLSELAGGRTAYGAILHDGSPIDDGIARRHVSADDFHSPNRGLCNQILTHFNTSS